GLRREAIGFHNHGFGNAGPTAGHLIPDYERVLRHGFKAIDEELEGLYEALSDDERAGGRGAQLRAMRTACSMPRELAARYRDEALKLAASEPDAARRAELERMAANLERVPWEGARDLWEAVQSLWLTHMLVMSDENYPGPGVSFGNLDRILDPFWAVSKEAGMSRELAKEILECFWIHANTAYDSMIKVGNQGITAGFGQLFNLSGLGPGGRDMTNDATWLLLEVIDDMSPMLEPKPNLRLHRGSPDALLDRAVDMIADSQGAPFLLNFDERSMAGMMRESRLAGVGELIREDNVHEYASVGCLENTMVGNDRSGTVDCNLNLLKAVELALGDGRPLVTFTDTITGVTERPLRQGPRTGDPRKFDSFDRFWEAYAVQTRHIVDLIARLYDRGDA
ncbi:MAG TPA: pyruvate formate lyase family protein, partial [Spirochaetales bacterium]|nr:pyruvate formate lyase family protein [Spirochaetales bacterium]